MMATHGDVQRLAMELPGAFEQASYGGRPSWRTKARMFTWIPELAEPEDGGPEEALVVWVDSLDEKEAMLVSEPDKFLTTPHYDGYAIVLVNLTTVELDELQELLIESWRQRATKTAVKKWDAEHPMPD